MALIGFVINPIAGMGGRVGLKGTDEVAAQAARLGAVPIANARALEALVEFKARLDREVRFPAIRWVTASGAMGADALKAAGFTAVAVAHECAGETTAKDTSLAVTRFLAAGVDLILFCGGDGTARDICAITGQATPVLGIPSGVKMYSGVFALTPARAADILLRFLRQEIGVTTVEILDLDEEKYRRGEWAVRLHMTASTPFEPNYVQVGKALVSSEDDASVHHDIAEHLREEIEAELDCLFLLGPGGTLEAVAHALGVDKTLLGIDAFADGRLVEKDVNEQEILDLLGRYPRHKLVLSPIGAQGFVLGRGNLQLSPTVIRRLGIDNIIVVATPAKLARTPLLHFDTGDAVLDGELTSRKFFNVVIGYRHTRLVRVAG